MATVDLTIDQLRAAILQLPAAKRRELLDEIEHLPTPDELRTLARRIRGKFRMKPKKRLRMSELLAKGNDGTLSASEGEELDALVEEFERNTLAMAQKLGHGSGYAQQR